MQSIIEFLKDREWHDLGEIKSRLNISERNLEALLKELCEYGLVEFSEDRSRVRLGLDWERLLIRESEEKFGLKEGVAIGTIIIPNGKSITIQNTQISNFSGEDLELQIKVDRRIREIAISKVS